MNQVLRKRDRLGRFVLGNGKLTPKSKYSLGAGRVVSRRKIAKQKKKPPTRKGWAPSGPR